jgi:hypothetical protein
MSERRPAIVDLAACGACAIVLFAACSGGRTEISGSRAAQSGPPAVSASPPSTLPHGDHNPHHGGVVMMKGDLHYELVFDPSGRAHQLYFSDAIREDLPAAFASAASLTLTRPGEPEETVPLEIDATGESWIGSGRPVADPERTTVRVSFTVENEPYWIDVPFKDTKGTKDTKATKDTKDTKDTKQLTRGGDRGF